MQPRHIAEPLRYALSDTPAVLVNGARQTGKSTLVQSSELGQSNRQYLTFDDPGILAAARRDPNGFVAGFGYTEDCALASTVAHDSHHMIVVGTNKADMAMAANILAGKGGGVVMVSKGKEVALVEMPIAGLMSDERAEVVAEKAAKLTEAMRRMGCRLNNAYMQHSLLALVVIPELRISDVGIIDVRTFEKVDLFV